MATGVLGNIVKPVSPYLDVVKDRVNGICEGLQPWQIVAYSCGGMVVFYALKDILFNDEETLKARTKKTFFRYVKKIPYVKAKIKEEKSKMQKDMNDNVHKEVESYVLQLPQKGLSSDNVVKELEEYRKLAHVDWKSGCCSGTVYSGDEKLTELMAKTYGMFAWTNPLHSDVFPDIRKMEAEVVRMCCTMFNGDKESCGAMTSGGTESILLACLAYRNRARERGIRVPEIIVPVTVHAAFDKAAAFFHMKITHIPIDEKTRKVDIKAMKSAISKQTCMLVGSAPSFPHGIIDDIEEIAKLGQQYDIPVHVDCCLGGFLVPFMEKAGFPIPVVDFRLEGVTSISADTHKYGYAPKGSSVILYRNVEYRQYQFFVQPDWPGGIYATSTVAGSRAGAIIAACWATLMHIGEDGYVDSTRKIIQTAKYIAAGLRKIKGIKVYGKPQMSVVGIGTENINVFRLADSLTSKGWNLNPLQFPSSIHICCTMTHTKEGVADRFLNDVSNSMEEIMKDPNSEVGGMGAIYGMAQSIPDRSMVSELVGCFLDAVYSTDKGN